MLIGYTQGDGGVGHFTGTVVSRCKVTKDTGPVFKLLDIKQASHTTRSNSAAP